ncbi:hypothetical protein FIV42_15625 [Persicimonas caeni]|uniref:Uncharacterized protein n=1 Tax=Persicimonas caeni TaxID=2292766 RepID=A0A4Y6PUV9_PERCE|nr:hypothetical protein [Persicimonas caeni]QDG52121.1 hypothetical protein FIV42_15625 [Persicimonas caeni]QED33342.1 hypothetical protein FRD00_15620 [Persicimonas caeni]
MSLSSSVTVTGENLSLALHSEIAREDYDGSSSVSLELEIMRPDGKYVVRSWEDAMTLIAPFSESVELIARTDALSDFLMIVNSMTGGPRPITDSPLWGFLEPLLRVPLAQLYPRFCGARLTWHGYYLCDGERHVDQFVWNIPEASLSRLPSIGAFANARDSRDD